jgi:hypothetical protein
MLQRDHLLLGPHHVGVGVRGHLLRLLKVGRQLVAQVLAVGKLELGIQSGSMHGKWNTLQTAIKVSF